MTFYLGNNLTGITLLLKLCLFRLQIQEVILASHTSYKDEFIDFDTSRFVGIVLRVSTDLSFYSIKKETPNLKFKRITYKTIKILFLLI